MNVSQRIPHFLDGVSQQPDVLRSPTHAVILDNGLPSGTRGLTKRPPARHLANIEAANDHWGGAVVHTIDNRKGERYVMALLNGVLKVFNADTGDQVSVIPVNGASNYLTDGTRGYRAVTIGDTTVILNRSLVVGRTNKRSATRDPEALIWVKKADYATAYRVFLDSKTYEHKTISDVDPASAAQVTTEGIAAALAGQIEATGAYKVVRYGSVVYLQRKDKQKLTIRSEGGEGDMSLGIVTDSAQAFEDLPPFAPDGYVVNVAGDEGTQVDDYYLVYDEGTTMNRGVWRETVAPGINTELDPRTMPVRLVKNGKLGGLDLKVAAFGPNPREALFKGALGRGRNFSFSDGSGSPNVTEVMTTHDQYVICDFDAASGRVKVRWTFHIDCSKLPAGHSVVVLTGVSGSPNIRTFNVPKVYRAGYVGYNESIEYEWDTGGGTFYTHITMHYDGGTPPAGSEAKVVLEGGPDPCFRVDSDLEWGYRFDPHAWYNSEAKFDLTVGTTVYSHTVPAGLGQTGAQVATALFNLAKGHAGIIMRNDEPGIIAWQNDTGTGVPPARGMSVGGVKSGGNNAYLPGAAFASDELTGLKVVNRTDGSSATVQRNTGNTLVCDTPVGGTKNAFSPGDEVELHPTATTSYFALELCPWRGREVGNYETAPWPSFHRKKISDLFVYQGRLGFVTEQNVILSGAGDVFNFFRQSGRRVLDDDVIDIESANVDTTEFHSAIPWNGGLYLFSEKAQYVLGGDPVLTPRTVRLDQVSQYPTDPTIRPLPFGGSLLLARPRGAAAQILEYEHRTYYPPDADDLTVHVPSFIPGKPRRIAGDRSLGFLAVSTDAAPKNVIYVFIERRTEDGERMQAAWSRWVFQPGAEVVWMDMVGGKLALVFKRASGMFLETIDLASGLSAL